MPTACTILSLRGLLWAIRPVVMCLGLGGCLSLSVHVPSEALGETTEMVFSAADRSPGIAGEDLAGSPRLDYWQQWQTIPERQPAVGPPVDPGYDGVGPMEGPGLGPLSANDPPQVPESLPGEPLLDGAPPMRTIQYGGPQALLRGFPQAVCEDYCRFYRWPTFRGLLLGLGGASILANTSLDHGFRDWYQEDVASRDLSRAAYFWKAFGDGAVFIPTYACLAVAGSFFDDYPAGHFLMEFGDRATRAYAVGVPPMLFGQFLLGGSRPGEKEYDSRWSPFHDDNAVSGHAFIGAVPFITLARMTENPWLKGGFYGLSALPAWSRVEHDMHYLSQICLGWWMAYLACASVTPRRGPDQGFTIDPVAAPDYVGMMVVFRR